MGVTGAPCTANRATNACLLPGISFNLSVVVTKQPNVVETMKASPWSFRGRQVQLWKKARSLIGKLSFMVGAAMVFGSYLYNTHLQWSVATTSQGSLSYFTATTDFVESYFGTCPGRINSYRWLVGARFGNIHTELNDNVIEQMSLFYTATTSDDLSASLLGQSLCYPQSQFRNVTVPSLPLAVDETTGSNADNNIDRLIRQWAVKLIYLSLYYHQHRHAIPEAEQRYRNAQPEQNGNSCLSQSQLTTDYGVGRYDYECPGAKYLVLPLGGNGLGANVRGGMVPAMLMGLMANRVVLFMNNLPTSVNADPDYINLEWPLASCSRKDHQCFFWPVSPCVLTEDDMISHTYYLNVSESRKLLNRREIPSYVDHYKVWVFQSAWTPISNFHPEAAQKLYEIAQELIQSTNLFSGYDSELLSAAVESILIDDGERDVYNYAAATMKVQHTTTIYTLRPNPQVAQKLDSILADIMPPNFNPEYSIGLPVRGMLLLTRATKSDNITLLMISQDTHFFHFFRRITCSFG